VDAIAMYKMVVQQHTIGLGEKGMQGNAAKEQEPHVSAKTRVHDNNIIPLDPS
jgi:hypothetical protein